MRKANREIQLPVEVRIWQSGPKRNIEVELAFALHFISLCPELSAHLKS